MATKDAEEEFFCQPCSKSKREIKARCVCYECNELLCEQCSSWHLVFSKFERHRLIELVPYLASQRKISKPTRVKSAVRNLLDNITIPPETSFFAQVAIEKDQPRSQSSIRKVDESRIKVAKCLDFSVKRDLEKKVTEDDLIGLIFIAECIVVFDIDYLNLLDSHGSFISSTKTDAETRCITPVSESSFATSGYGNKVFIWKVKEKSIVKENTTYRIDHVAHGIHFNGKYFCVLHSVNNSISILEQEGKMVKKIIKEKAFDKKIKFGWDLHMDRETNNIYLLLENEEGVLCLSIQGEDMWFIPLAGIRGITEIHGSLCVADAEKACLHLMHKEGQYARVLLNEENLKGTPYSVSFADNEILYVTYAAPSDRRHTIALLAVSCQ